jgi:hypothetical protein
MEYEKFVWQVELLTGSEVKGREQIDRESVEAVLKNDAAIIDCSHFNELLLLVHKDRIEHPFFDHFFGKDCTIADLPERVAEFQRVALLLYGNFVFAYRKLSRIKDSKHFKDEMAQVCKDTQGELAAFHNRKPKLLEVDRISRDLTPFVGYLSARDIPADLRSCEFLQAAVKEVGHLADWEQLSLKIEKMANPSQKGSLFQIVQNYRDSAPQATIKDLDAFLQISFESLTARKNQIDDVRERATRNQNTYLTWDHMDVYFATSMRKAWEYMDLYDFIEGLMKCEEFADLNLRYFDPTQAFTENRINKGLVEALMLKRAKCTVYSVQDTDTLGKDSELASTLAQGKPVIAFVPDIDVASRAEQLTKEDPATILERLNFVVYADEDLAKRLGEDGLQIVDRVQDSLAEFCSKRIWISIPDQNASSKLRTELGSELTELCTIIASSEKAVYDKRARTLKESHPLAVQVNLTTGVANGVLVVRTIDDCADLLRRMLISDMQFNLRDNAGMWELREEISGCIYRVVTNDRKLNNSFWNFYLRN